MARKKKAAVQLIVPVVSNIPMDAIIEPIHQRTPLDDAKRDWARREMNHLMPYGHQTIGQRIMGEAVKYRAPKYMTDEGVNRSQSAKHFRTDLPFPV